MTEAPVRGQARGAPHPRLLYDRLGRVRVHALSNQSGPATRVGDEDDRTVVGCPSARDIAAFRKREPARRCDRASVGIEVGDVDRVVKGEAQLRRARAVRAEGNRTGHSGSQAAGRLGALSGRPVLSRRICRWVHGCLPAPRHPSEISAARPVR